MFENTLATVKCELQLAENTTLGEVISTEAAHVDIASIHDYLTSKVAFEEPEIGRNDPNIPIDNDCTDDTLHFRMPGGSEGYEDDDEEIEESDAIPSASR